ncbi:hypothetical protein ACFYWU_37555 [Streptomyces chrestomyceticus]|uniref:hypothetical protein n=1 Tax=Streptomyces chrestomyceticus TaxID=68185 RepID=UPI0036B08E8A
MQQAITDPSPTPDPAVLLRQFRAVKEADITLTKLLEQKKLYPQVHRADDMFGLVSEARRTVELRFARSAVREVCAAPWSDKEQQLQQDLTGVSDVQEQLGTLLDASDALWDALGQRPEEHQPPS